MWVLGNNQKFWLKYREKKRNVKQKSCEIEMKMNKRVNQITYICITKKNFTIIHIIQMSMIVQMNMSEPFTLIESHLKVGGNKSVEFINILYPILLFFIWIRFFVFFFQIRNDIEKIVLKGNNHIIISIGIANPFTVNFFEFKFIYFCLYNQ